MSNASVDVTPESVVNASLVIDADVTPDVLIEKEPCECVLLVAIEPEVMLQPPVLSNPSVVELPTSALEPSRVSSPKLPPHAASAPAVASNATYHVLRFIGFSR